MARVRKEVKRVVARLRPTTEAGPIGWPDVALGVIALLGPLLATSTTDPAATERLVRILRWVCALVFLGAVAVLAYRLPFGELVTLLT
jgi:hypothetical protein